ncbi:MAG: autotransporter domain-containing protein [Sphingomonadales bacterium]
MASFFGTDQMLFCTPADPKSGLTGQRCFANFSEAAAEAGISRIYGGIHFEFDDSRAILAGEQIGAYIEANYFGLARAGAYTGYDGIISGTSGLTIVADAEILGGVNSYTGRTVIYSGASLSLRGAGSIAASSGVTANGTFDISATDAGARITSLSGIGNVVLGSQQLTLTNASESFAGVISGAGSLGLEQGTLTLAGVNSFTGRTAISSGAALSLQGSGSIAASSGVAANGTFDISATSAGARITSLSGTGRVELGSQRLTLTNASESFTGVIAGAGSLGLEQGTLTLGSANSYAGGTIVNGGTVRITNSAALGTGTVNFAGGTSLVAGTAGLALANGIVTRGTLAIDSGAGASTFTLGGAVSGSGGIAKQGTGVLTMAGASSYTGATSVLAGTLNVTGSLASVVTVTAGAAATGNGRVASLSVLAGATINPGAPGSTDVATLTVAGAATLAGTFTADVTSLGNDRITAGGALTLGGALVVNRSAQASFLTFNQVYTLASGATRSGSFATVSGLGNFGIAFAPVVEYGATQASLRLAPNSLVAIGTQFGGLNGNALETARAIDGAVAAGYNPQPLFAVYATAGAALPRTLAEMSGEQRATERRVVLDSNRVFRETALDRLNQGTTAFGSQQVKTGAVTVWLRGAAAGTRADTSGAATAFKTAQLGVLTGVDFARNNVTIGAAFHYTTTDVTFRVLGGSSRVETVGATAYAGWRQADKGVVINAGASVSGARTSGNRAVTLTGFGQTLNGNALGTTYQLFAELAYDLAKSGNTRIEPFVRGSTITADMGASVESGGSAALSSPSQHYHLAVVNAGVRVATAVDGGAISLNASASVQSTSGSRDAATLLGLSGTGQYGNIRSVAMDPTALQIQAGTAFRLSGKARLGVDYVGLYGRNNNDYGARATLDVAF